MAEKKVSELTQVNNLDNDDEFLVVDKSEKSGADASNSGKTSKVQLWQLKEAVSASGPKGDKGDQGVTGATGAKGDAGSQGVTGPQGPKGNQGATGPQGPTGGKGNKGDQGAIGPQGPRGTTGPMGPQGNNGLKGSPGNTGAPGPEGRAGAKGNAGANGARGIQGIQGQRGATGGVGPKGNTGATGPTGNRGLTGPQGPKGDRGATGARGPAGPTNPYVQQLSDGSSSDYKTSSSRRVNPNSKNPTNHHYAISTFGNQGNVTGQLATHYQTGQAYTRGFNSSWSSWRQLFDNRSVCTFGSGHLRVVNHMYLRNEKRSDHQSYVSSDSNGFTRVGGQYGVGFLGNGVNWTGAADSAEFGRFTSCGTDYKGSSKLCVGTYKNFARIDICNGSSIFQQRGVHGDNLYISCLAHYQHAVGSAAGGWFFNETGNATVLGLARNGMHMHTTNEVHSKGQKVKAYSHDMFMSSNGSMHVRGGFHKLSDIREKKNIKSLNRIESLDKILNLNPVSYQWKNHESDTDVKLGLIAQEVEKLVPSVVSEIEENKMAGGQVFPSRKSVDYEALVPLLISSIQNQQQQINQLRSQLNSK